MGEGKKKKLQALQAATAVAGLQHEELAAAVRQVVGAMTDFHGADCLLFAAISAGALRELGFDARPVAGSTAWRVGPGDSDTISHAREIQGPLYTPGKAGQALQFHAWVEAPGLLVDFSTCTLRKKAAMLDAADGGKTQVDWAPDYLWLAGPRPTQMLKTPNAVNQSYYAGVYCYIRHSDIEATVLPNITKLLNDLHAAVAAAVTAYHARCAGHTLQVVGIGEDATFQTEPKDISLVKHPQQPSAPAA